MRQGTWLRALLADISHWLGDRRDGGCDFHARSPSWRELRRGNDTEPASVARPTDSDPTDRSRPPS